MDSKIKKLVADVALAGAVTVGTAGVAVAAEDVRPRVATRGARCAGATPASGVSSAQRRSRSSPTPSV